MHIAQLGHIKNRANISRLKNNLKHFKNIANIIVQYKGIVQCFLAQQLGTALLEKYYCTARIPVILYNNDYFYMFPLSIMGGLMRIKNSHTYKRSNSRIVTI